MNEMNTLADSLDWLYEYIKVSSSESNLFRWMCSDDDERKYLQRHTVERNLKSMNPKTKIEFKIERSTEIWVRRWLLNHVAVHMMTRSRRIQETADFEIYKSKEWETNVLRFQFNHYFAQSALSVLVAIQSNSSSSHAFDSFSSNPMCWDMKTMSAMKQVQFDILNS